MNSRVDPLETLVRAAATSLSSERVAAWSAAHAERQPDAAKCPKFDRYVKLLDLANELGCVHLIKKASRRHTTQGCWEELERLLNIELRERGEGPI